MSSATSSERAVPEDVRPVVRTANPGNLGMWIFGGLLLAGGLALFLSLNARRAELASPGTETAASGGMIAAPPPISLPQDYSDQSYAQNSPLVRPVPFPVAGPVAQAPVVTRVIERPAPSIRSDSPVFASSQPTAPPYVQPALPVAPAAEPIGSDEERVSASRLANPSMTIPKGTIMAAVLETALDSSRAGGVRAIVSRDVRSFDGSRVLIPRGSRLYGEYAADVTAGQKRAMIEWHRLLRADGVTIELNSPSADPLGRAGVEGKVDSNFFARFGGAILQSVLDIGVALASGAVLDDAVIINAPQRAQQAASDAVPPPPQPRLRIQQGSSVSVFVARDLDFSSVGG